MTLNAPLLYGAMLKDALRRKFKEVKSVKQPERAAPAQTRPRGRDEPLQATGNKGPA
jgi:hypothetical protein